MAHMLTRQAFPRTTFDALSKSECLNFLEILHFVMQAETLDHVRDVLIRFQNYFSFTKALGGLVRLGPNRTFAGFGNVVNASYPDEWLYLYWKNGFADVDPVFK
ncbi:MAG: hypothetical protein AAB308_04175, partial [Nitrospirota bacterium]